MKALLIFVATIANNPQPEVVNGLMYVPVEQCQAMAVESGKIALAFNILKSRGITPEKITGACVEISPNALDLMNNMAKK